MPVVLLTEVTLFVHEVDTTAHPTVPPGWRWAVHAGGGRPADLSLCVNAGWCPTRNEALFEGERNAATAVKACRVFGVPVEYRQRDLAADPIPAGCDFINVGV